MAFREVDVPLRHARTPEAAVGSKPSFTFLPSGDLFKPLPARPYLVESFVPRGSIIVVGGYGSSSKSWLALSTSLSVAQGTPWLERFNVEQSLPSYLDFEAGEFETRR